MKSPTPLYQRCQSSLTNLPSPSKCQRYVKGTQGCTKLFIGNFALQNPFSEGHFKCVTLGTFTQGTRADEQAVIKWTKYRHDDDMYTTSTSGSIDSIGSIGSIGSIDGDGDDDDDDDDNEVNMKNRICQSVSVLKTEVRIAKKALRMTTAFNDMDIWHKKLFIILPEIWKITKAGRHDYWYNNTLLVEPFMNEFKKYNSNKDWCDDSNDVGRVMQALSHFSYHISNGEYLLCDIQAGVLEQDITLTDVAILSKNYEFGASDLGVDGMTAFFDHHRCNKYCCAKWMNPSNNTSLF